MTRDQINNFVSTVMQSNIQAICTLIENDVDTMKIEFEHHGKKYVWYFAPNDEVMIMQVEK